MLVSPLRFLAAGVAVAFTPLAAIVASTIAGFVLVESVSKSDSTGVFLPGLSGFFQDFPAQSRQVADESSQLLAL